MIIGIGTDIIEIDRVLKACENKRFLKKCYTNDEIKICEKSPKKYASNFAVKEALSKALGIGFSSFNPSCIEVLRDDFGAPFVNLHFQAKKKCDKIGVEKIFVSISHNKKNTIGFVILEGKSPDA